jgi:uncharacterized protein with LGFP repeats
VRRSLAGVIAFLAFTTPFLVPPVHAAPLARPVETSTESILMGSLFQPAVGALVRPGSSVQAVGIPQAPPALSVMRTGTQEFSLVGVTWTYDPAVTDTGMRVRVQSTAGTWSEWTEIEAHGSGPDATATPETSVRGGTEPVWTGPSTGVEAEVVTHSGAHPLDVHLDLVVAGTSAADTTLVTPLQDSAQAAAAAIHTREEWGADESIRTWKPEYASTIKAATLHHTAGTNAYTAGQVPAMIRGIYRYHAVSRGWGDIGYNVLVDRFGQIWEGRSGGLKSTVIGAHAAGFNTGTVGVALLGNYDSVDTTAPMIDAAEAFIAWKFSLFHVDPTATTKLTSGGGGTAKYPRGVRVNVPTIFAHQDVGSTLCPGRYGYARLPEIRTAVAQRLANARPLSHSE